MTASRPDPERWSDRAGHGAAVEDVVGAALRHTRDATSPSEAVIARLEVALAARQAAPRSRRPLTLAFAMGALLSLGGTVGATRGIFRAWIARPAPVPAAETAREVPVRRVARVAEAAPERMPVSPVEPAEAPRARHHALVHVPPAQGVPEDVTPPDQAPPPPPDPAAEEAALVARAFRVLRTDRRPVAALEALDERERRFPGGALVAEARVARAEALVALGRGPDALSLVDGVDGGALPRSLRLARAELRSGVERCADATSDFDAVLVGGDDDALGERALYGRASCRLTSRDIAGARADLQRLLAVHGDGRFAIDARRALDRLVAP